MDYELSKDEGTLVSKLKKRKDHKITIAELAEALPTKRGVTDKTSRARNALRRPVKLGLVKQVGRGEYALGNGKPPKAKAEVVRKKNGYEASLRTARQALVPDKALPAEKVDLANVAAAAVMLGDAKQASKIAAQLGYSRGKVIRLLKKLPKKLPSKVTKSWLLEVIGHAG